jgi:hypothetical protein
MPIQLSDAEIGQLIQEPKLLPENYRERMVVKPKRGHKERELDLTGARGSAFRLILRQGLANPLDFSVILAYCLPASNLCFRLRRYNGKSHEHTNQLEGDSFYAFHIHTATERYQISGLREDAYAEPSERFADFAEGCRCMLKDCGFQEPPQPQGMFWNEDL